MAEMKSVEAYRKQVQQLEDLKKQAISEMEGLLDEAKSHVSRLQAELDELKGASSAQSAKTSSKAKKTNRQLDPNKPCSVCGFATEPNHDARSHRGQDTQKAFTKAELEAKGMSKK